MNKKRSKSERITAVTISEKDSKLSEEVFNTINEVAQEERVTQGSKAVEILVERYSKLREIVYGDQGGEKVGKSKVGGVQPRL